MEKSSTDEFLGLEYGYIQDNIQQTVHDRYRMLSFYITIGTTIATVLLGILSLQNIDQELLRKGVGLISILMWLIGLVFLLIMIRLRQAWFQGIVALNKIKAFYLSEAQGKLDNVVDWQNSHMPRANKLWNIHFYSSFLVIAISSGFIALAIWVLNLGDPWVAAVIGIVNMLLQTVFYRYSLARNI
jgi:hypothetical protein